MIYGIDLGTTLSSIGYWEDNKEHIIATIPSVISYTGTDKYVGNVANKQKDINVGNTFYEFKRLIGNKFSSIEDKEYFNFHIEPDENDEILIKPECDETLTLTPVQLSADILKELKKEVMRKTGQVVKDVVITIPALFNDRQRQATKDAAAIADLNLKMLVNEPTAAALAFGFHNRGPEEKKVIVYDFGGGTLDISLLVISDGFFRVVGTSGNSRLGGLNFDNTLVVYCKLQFCKREKLDKNTEFQQTSLQKLKSACESAKKKLSDVTKVKILVENFHNGKHLNVNVTRARFEAICSTLFTISLHPLNILLKEEEYSEKDITETILVGGMTRTPKLRELIHSKMGKMGNCSIDPETAVSAGASLLGYVMENANSPFSREIILKDVTSLSLGIETAGGIMETLIQRGTFIPAKKTKLFTNDTDLCESIDIKVYEGERLLASDNLFLGSFTLAICNPKPAHSMNILVTFSIDENCTINVSASDLDDKDTSNSIIVSGNRGKLTEQQISKLIKESNEYEFLDKVLGKKIRLLDQLCRMKEALLENCLPSSEDNVDILNTNLSASTSAFSKLFVTPFKVDSKEVSVFIKWVDDAKDVPVQTLDLDKLVYYSNYAKREFGPLINKRSTTKLTTITDNQVTEIYSDDIANCSKDTVLINGSNENFRKEVKDFIDECTKVRDQIESSNNVALSSENKNAIFQSINDNFLFLYSEPDIEDYELNSRREAFRKLVAQVEKEESKKRAELDHIFDFENCLNLAMLLADSLGQEEQESFKRELQNDIDWVNSLVLSKLDPLYSEEKEQGANMKAYEKNLKLADKCTALFSDRLKKAPIKREKETSIFEIIKKVKLDKIEEMELDDCSDSDN